MATAGPFFAGTGANFNDGGTTAWATPTNVQGDTTGTAATFNTATAGGTSQRLRASNFGFEIPSDATIDGITVEVEQVAANTNRHRWLGARLLIAGTESGDDLSDASTITNSQGFKAFGDALTLWGLTPTPAQVNASGFGFSAKVERFGNATTSSFSRIRVTVDYTEAGGPQEYQQGVSGALSFVTSLARQADRAQSGAVSFSGDLATDYEPAGGEPPAEHPALRAVHIHSG